MRDQPGALLGRAKNYAHGEYTPTETPAHYPEHLVAVEEDHHDAVCRECGYWITLGAEGREYGHRRYTNGPKDQPRRSCPHRPGEAVDPQKQWANTGAERRRSA